MGDKALIYPNFMVKNIQIPHCTEDFSANCCAIVKRSAKFNLILKAYENWQILS